MSTPPTPVYMVAQKKESQKKEPQNPLKSPGSSPKSQGSTPIKTSPGSKAKGILRKLSGVFRKSSDKKHGRGVYPPELIQLCSGLARTTQLSDSPENSYTFHEVNWPVQKHNRNYSLVIPPPYHKGFDAEFTLNIDSFVGQLPEKMAVIYKKADPQKLINLMLPHGVICEEARKVAAAFWLWLCITDDILEDMNDADFEGGINDMHKSLIGAKTGYNYDSEISWITRLYKELIDNTMITGLNMAMQHKWRSGLITCIQEIAHAFELERPLLRAGKSVKLEDWMKLRVVTISARPFMVLARASLKLPGEMSPLGNPFSPKYQKFPLEHEESDNTLVRLETTMQCVLGLQNDILGWEKDNKEDLNLNCVQIILFNWNSGTGTDAYSPTALSTAIEAHNLLVQSVVSRASQMMDLKEKTFTQLSQNASTFFTSVHSTAMPSLAQSPTDSSAATREPSPRASVVSLDGVNPQVVDSDNNSEIMRSSSEAGNEAVFKLFGRTVRVPWTPASRPVSPDETDKEYADRIATYINVLLNMGNGMAVWMINSKRYEVKKD